MRYQQVQLPLTTAGLWEPLTWEAPWVLGIAWHCFREHWTLVIHFDGLGGQIPNDGPKLMKQ